MRSNSTRIALAVGAIAALVVLFVVLNSGSSDNKSNKTTSTAAGTTAGTTAGGPSTTTPAPAAQAITVRKGKPVGGIKKLEYTKGDQVRFRVSSDVADEIHVHGYDFHKEVPAGGSVSFSFPAKIDGVFVIELEGRGEQIAELRVKPA
jgi:hypothetical protein